MSDDTDVQLITAEIGGQAQVGTNGRVQLVDPALAKFLGYDAGDFKHPRFHDITHPDDLLRDEPQFERLLEQGCGIYSILKRYFTAKGEFVWTERSVELFRTKSGAPQYFMARVR